MTSRTAIERWRAQDPDPDTINELDALIDAAKSGDEAAAAELTDSFAGTLTFGTAGIRGRLGPGPNRMNRVVVARTAAGLATYLETTAARSVVIGYDARHRSRDFAIDCAEILSGFGLDVRLAVSEWPTPLLAFAVLRLHADAGVMITASHNPPQDNGIKVYLADGSQIVSPVDAQIASAMESITDIRSLPRSQTWTDCDVTESYLDRAVALVRDVNPELRMIYTPLHGVGGRLFLAACDRIGLANIHTVTEQFAPDPDFPTVTFPNPEEPGAMDAALSLAAGADIIVAHDPDADRCAVGVGGASPRMLSGDEVGWLLGWWLTQREVRGTFAQSIVSGDMLHDIATSAGLEYARTLTGFKWLARVPALAFAYEEALGYCVDPDYVRDKDGITAALLITELAGVLKRTGRTLDDALIDLYRHHGVYLTGQVSRRFSSTSDVGRVMDRLRAAPPDDLGGSPVISVEDLADGVDGLPATDGLRWRTVDRSRVIIRPSGTEAKVKCYLQIHEPASETLEADLDDARNRRDRLVASLSDVIAADLVE